MIRLRIFNGRGELSEEEIVIGQPDDLEAKSLEHHTRKCILRYRTFTKRQAEHSQELNEIKLIMLIGFVVMAAVSETGKSVIASVFGVL